MLPHVLLSFSLLTQSTMAAYQLSIPLAPPPGTQVLTGAFQGFSMEMADFPRIAGNISSPNQLSIRMLENLKDITGLSPGIRIGGTTANHATWIPNQQEAIVRYYATPGADQPANVTLGLAYLESFKTFPAGTKYTVGLTFNNGSAGQAETITEATAFSQGLGSDLYAFEIGNEFDIFPVDRNTSTWSIRKYIPEWIARAAAVSNALGLSRIYQAGVFVAPGSLNSDTSWTAQATLDLGVSAQQAKSYSTHQYFGAACGPVKPTLAGALMNRTNLRRYMAYHANASAYTVSKGIPYVIGETNSIACQGLAGVSDVFGAAVWAVDYALYAASLNVSGMDWHMGVGYRYAPWQAVQNGTTAAGPRPLYYANLMIATALGVGKQVVQVVNDNSLAGYAVYRPKGVHRQAGLESLVLVNMEVYNSTAVPNVPRSSVVFQVPDGCANARVLRLTAAGAEVRDGISLGGQSVGVDGSFVGQQAAETVVNGTVVVRASEIVLIRL